MIGRARTLSGVVLAIAMASAAPDTARAQAPLTRDQVLGALAGASPAHPADFTGQDLSGLDLAGVDFKRANLTKARLVRTNLTRAQLNSATLTDAVATQADLTDADVAGADLAGAILKGIRGRDRLRGLDKALHVDQAIFND